MYQPDASVMYLTSASQLLQLLLELNSSPEVPPSLRYDLSPFGTANKLKVQTHQNKQIAHETLRIGRDKIQKGETTISSYEEGKSDILESLEFEPSRSYAELCRFNTSTARPHDETADPSMPTTAGYMTIRQEEQYLQSIDAFIAGKNTNPRAHAANSLGSKSAEKTSDREREMQLRNPVSVYNWLRKHQPQVFLQDHETNNDKGSKVSGSRSSKRTNPGKDSKQDQEYYDEDGIALEYSTTSRGKRKRNDDGAFRPKGGKPGHGPKRRKEESGKRSKRSSMDARASLS